MRVQHKVAVHGVQHKVAVHGGLTTARLLIITDLEGC